MSKATPISQVVRQPMGYEALTRLRRATPEHQKMHRQWKEINGIEPRPQASKASGTDVKSPGFLGRSLEKGLYHWHYRPRWLLSRGTASEKGYEVHGLKRRASSFNTSRIDHLYQDPQKRTQGCFCTMAISPTAAI